MLTDIAIIGAGPLGIELHIALKRANFSVQHFDARQIGGTIAWWAPQTRWFSSPERIAIAGVPLASPTGEKTTREEYLAYLRNVVSQFNLPIRTYTRITKISRNPDQTFTLTAQNSLNPSLPPATHTARNIILATGGTESPNLLHIPGESLPHVSHYFQDPHTYFRKNLLIVGGKNSAVEAALRAHRAGARVSVSYRQPAVDKDRIKYWLYPEFSSLLKSRDITPHMNTIPTAITPTHVTLLPTPSPVAPPTGTNRPSHSNEPTDPTPAPSENWKLDTGNSFEIPADFVLLLTGYLADMSLFTQLGVPLTGDNQSPTFNPDTMETNIKNVYAAGTAIAGTQTRYKIFLENCHIHVDRILAALQGRPIHTPTPHFDRDEA